MWAKLDMYVCEFGWQWGSCRKPPFKDANGFHKMKREVIFTDYLDLENVANKPVSCKGVFWLSRNVFIKIY